MRHYNYKKTDSWRGTHQISYVGEHIIDRFSDVVCFVGGWGLAPELSESLAQKFTSELNREFEAYYANYKLLQWENKRLREEITKLEEKLAQKEKRKE